MLLSKPTDLLQGTLDLLILKTIALEPMHGWAIAQRIRQISGDVLHNPGLGYAVAMGMVLIMAFSIIIYSVLQRRSERWLK